VAFELLQEFARDPLGWVGSFGRDLKREVGEIPTPVEVGSGVKDAVIGRVEDLPFDTGLILTQAVSDPGTFGDTFAVEFPKEAKRLFGDRGVLGPFDFWFAVFKWMTVGVVAVAVIALVASFFPAFRGVSTRIEKVIG
jgi:hypothetical protein